MIIDLGASYNIVTVFVNTACNGSKDLNISHLINSVLRIGSSSTAFDTSNHLFKESVHSGGFYSKANPAEGQYLSLIRMGEGSLGIDSDDTHRKSRLSVSEIRAY